jgi:zona occludens toxin
MSITSYTGLPGSGKSYSVVEYVILPALESNRQIYTNIELNLAEVFTKYPRARITVFDNDEPKENERFWESIPAGTLIIIDEVMRYWPAGMKANDIPVHQLEFFSKHRHKVGTNGYSQEIVLVTQDLAQVAAAVRQLVEKTYRSTKQDHVGLDKHFRIDIYNGAVTGQNPPIHSRIQEIPAKYKPEVFRYYKSHTLSETGSAGNEKKTDRRANVLKGWRIKAIVVFIPLAVISSIYLFSTFLDSYKNDYGVTEPKAIIGVDPRIETETQLQLHEKQEEKTHEDQDLRKSEIQLSTRWRVVGSLIGETDPRKAFVVIQSNETVRTIPIKDNCQETNITTGLECIIEGEYITEYSGQLDMNIVSPGIDVAQSAYSDAYDASGDDATEGPSWYIPEETDTEQETSPTRSFGQTLLGERMPDRFNN